MSLSDYTCFDFHVLWRNPPIYLYRQVKMIKGDLRRELFVVVESTSSCAVMRLCPLYSALRYTQVATLRRRYAFEMKCWFLPALTHSWAIFGQVVDLSIYLHTYLYLQHLHRHSKVEKERERWDNKSIHIPYIYWRLSCTCLYLISTCNETFWVVSKLYWYKNLKKIILKNKNNTIYSGMPCFLWRNLSVS